MLSFKKSVGRSSSKAKRRVCWLCTATWPRRNHTTSSPAQQIYGRIAYVDNTTNVDSLSLHYLHVRQRVCLAQSPTIYSEHIHHCHQFHQHFHHHSLFSASFALAKISTLHKSITTIIWRTISGPQRLLTYLLMCLKILTPCISYRVTRNGEIKRSNAF